MIGSDIALVTLKCRIHLFLTVRTFFANLTPQQMIVYFYGESIVYKVWSLNLFGEKKRRSIPCHSQRSKNHPTSNIFKIRKHSLISKRIFPTNKKLQAFLLTAISVLKACKLTKSSHGPLTCRAKGL